MRASTAVASGLLLVLTAALAAQDRVFETYPDESTVSALRSTVDDALVTDLSGDASLTSLGTSTGEGDVGATTGIATLATFTVAGSATVEISGRFTNASATATVVVIRGDLANDGDWTTQSHSVATLSASATYTDGASAFMAPALYFDSKGSDAVKVVAVPSAGTLDLWVR